MKPVRISKEEAQDYKRRWELANAAEIEELRSMTPTEKFHQLVALMASVDDAGWREALQEEEAEVRARWIRIKEFYGVL